MMKLFGPASADSEIVHANIVARGAASVFVSQIFPAVWNAAIDYHVDPVGAVAQALKETGAGKFGGAIDDRWFNTCGLKVRNPNIRPELSGDQPLAHAMFPSWEVGAVAHIQHLRAYGGWAVPPSELIVDPRYVWVIGKHRLQEWSELGGKWAPSATYGQQIETLMRELSNA